MIINKFLTVEQIDKLENYYSMDINKLSDLFNMRKLQIFESKQHLITWLAMSNDQNARYLLLSLLDLEIGELRKNDSNNGGDAFIKTSQRICILGDNRYTYLSY